MSQPRRGMSLQPPDERTSSASVRWWANCELTMKSGSGAGTYSNTSPVRQVDRHAGGRRRGGFGGAARIEVDALQARLQAAPVRPATDGAQQVAIAVGDVQDRHAPPLRPVARGPCQPAQRRAVGERHPVHHRKFAQAARIVLGADRGLVHQPPAGAALRQVHAVSAPLMRKRNVSADHTGPERHGEPSLPGDPPRARQHRRSTNMIVADDMLPCRKQHFARSRSAAGSSPSPISTASSTVRPPRMHRPEIDRPGALAAQDAGRIGARLASSRSACAIRPGTLPDRCMRNPARRYAR